MQCPKCGYLRKENESAPDWQCPSCGVAYNKVIQANKENAPLAIAQPHRLEIEEEFDLKEYLEDLGTGTKILLFAIFSGWAYLYFSSIRPAMNDWIANHTSIHRYPAALHIVLLFMIPAIPVVLWAIIRPGKNTPSQRSHR